MKVLRALIRRPAVALSLLYIVIVVLLALFAPWMSPHDPSEQFVEGLSMEGAPLPPDMPYWLGTDLLGRDLLSRLIYGARTSLFIGLLANGLAVLIGTLVGLSAGFLRGWIGSTLMRFYRLDDGVPGAAVGDCVVGDFPTQRVDRCVGHRHGQLGADCPGDLLRDHRLECP